VVSGRLEPFEDTKVVAVGGGSREVLAGLLNETDGGLAMGNVEKMPFNPAREFRNIGLCPALGGGRRGASLL